MTKKSHVCAKRMGEEQSRFIYKDFTDMAAAPGLTIYDPFFGISLAAGLDCSFDFYKICLRPINDGVDRGFL